MRDKDSLGIVFFFANRFILAVRVSFLKVGVKYLFWPEIPSATGTHDEDAVTEYCPARADENRTHKTAGIEPRF